MLEILEDLFGIEKSKGSPYVTAKAGIADMYRLSQTLAVNLFKNNILTKDFQMKCLGIRIY